MTLLGQNVNAYHGPDETGKERGLSYLINKISELDSIKRIAYSTSHPNNMTDDLIELHGNNTKLMSCLHLPVQSGSNKILKLMNRKHTRELYFEIIEKLRKHKTNIALSSDFIVGFPGEDEKDFADTIDLINQVGFMNSFSFKYSPRPGTPAADKKQLPLKNNKSLMLLINHTNEKIDFNKAFLNNKIIIPNTLSFFEEFMINLNLIKVLQYLEILILLAILYLYRLLTYQFTPLLEKQKFEHSYT